MSQEKQAQYKLRLEPIDGGFRITVEGPLCGAEPPPLVELSGEQERTTVESMMTSLLTCMKER